MKEERQAGLEPVTLGLGSRCSTNWAIAALDLFSKKDFIPTEWDDKNEVFM